MAVEKLEGGGLLITGEHINIYRLLALKQMLKLEILGLHGRGCSAYKTIKTEFNLKGSKQAVLDQYIKLLNDNGIKCQ